MIVGTPREIKPGELRVALTPAGARALVEAGHRVLVEREAGTGSGIRDTDYAGVGAELASADEVWRDAGLILKGKEPIPEEYGRLRAGQVLFTYLPTTLLDPVYRVGGVVHYGVANMPALVPRTSTFALTNATLPYVLELAGKGVRAAVLGIAELARGVNVWNGRIVHAAVAESLRERPVPVEGVLAEGDR